MNKKGFTIYITGLPGSGKTVIAKIIQKKLSVDSIDALEISGDEIRKIFKLNGYDIKSRRSYIKFERDPCVTKSEIQNVDANGSRIAPTQANIGVGVIPGFGDL